MTRLLPVFGEQMPSASDRAAQQQALEISARTGDPVLLLTARAAAIRSPLRALVPVDDLRAERRILQRWAERAQEVGIEVDQLHVLTEASTPAMWDGPGHHAAAWWAELRRRHLVDDRALQVETGDPTERILAAADRCDLIVLAWRGNPAPGHAEVVRGVLGQTVTPVLLVRRPPPGSAPSTRFAGALRKT